MLVNLHVKNLAIIDEIEVDFSDKLNVLTGETGAGKSIIIDSINLALYSLWTQSRNMRWRKWGSWFRKMNC